MTNETSPVLTLRHIAILFIIALVWLAFPATAHAQKSFFWDSFDVLVEVEENGDLTVTETQTLVFSGGTFTFGYATINKNQLDRITNISVSEGGRSYVQDQSNGPYTFNVDYGSNVVTINWYFPPTQGRNTYVFQYTVEGAIKVDPDAYQLRWIAVPSDMLSTVSRSQVTVRVPEGVTISAGAASVDGVDLPDEAIAVSADFREITVSASSIVPGDVFEVGIRFPLDQLDLEQPAWQSRAARADRYGLIAAVLGVLVLLGGPTLVLLLWYTRGRDPEVGLVADILSEPPSDLPPAIAGTLVDERADMRDIMSTMVDLARRGYLTMQEEKNNFQFTRTTKPTNNLRTYEKEFLKGIFGTKTERDLNSLRYKFADKLPKIRNLLYDELVDGSLTVGSPETVRNRYRGLALGVSFLGFLGFFVSSALAETVATAVCPVLALIPAIMALFYTSTHMPRKTHEGAEEAAKWRAFRKYLQSIDEHRDLGQSAELFDRYLAYAIAFGFERSWIRKFEKLENVPAPTWYGPMRPVYRTPRGGRQMSQPLPPFGGGAGVPAPSGGGVPSLEGMSGSLTTSLNNMSSGLTRMLNSSSTVLQSVKPSSSSSGGGSFSGGGFSGGGFSGGSSGGGGRGFG